MSKGLVCDHCQSVIPLNARGEADSGEDAAWVRISTVGFDTTWDACSRSCAVELLEGEIGAVLDAELEAITKISQAIGGEDDD